MVETVTNIQMYREINTTYDLIIQWSIMSLSKTCIYTAKVIYNKNKCKWKLTPQLVKFPNSSTVRPQYAPRHFSYAIIMSQTNQHLHSVYNVTEESLFAVTITVNTIIKPVWINSSPTTVDEQYCKVKSGPALSCLYWQLAPPFMTPHHLSRYKCVLI